VSVAINVAVPGLAGLWLASHGQLLDLAMGAVMAAVLPFAWRHLAQRPVHLVTGRLTAPETTANLRIVMGVAFVAALWQAALLGAWALGSFTLFGRDPRPGDEPVLAAWAWGTVMAPLALLAPPRLDLGNPKTIPFFYAIGACVLCAFGFLNGDMTDPAWVLASLTVVAAIASSALVARNAQLHRRARAASDEAFAPVTPSPAAPATPAHPQTARRATKRAQKDSSPPTGSTSNSHRAS
jgi:hypothetical protein